MIGTEFDVSDLVNALRRAETEIDRLLPDALELAGNLVAAEARANHDYTDRSGSLTNSIQVEGVARSGDEIVVTVAAGAPHAAAIEYGSKPHRIIPRHRQVLRWPIEGGFRFARGVNHPGNRAYRYLENALERKLPQITRMIEDAIDLAFTRAGLG